MTVANWDTNMTIKMKCADCSEKVPEFCLVENGDWVTKYGSESDEWVVVDHHQEHAQEKEEYDKSDVERLPNGEVFDIFMRDTSNKSALQEAREEVENRLP